MKKTLLTSLSLLITALAGAQSFSGTYPFTDVNNASGITDPTPVPTATGVTFGSFSAAGTPANPNASGRFSFIDWSLGAAAGETVYSNLTGAISTSEYYEVTLAPTAGYLLSIDSISFTFQRSGTGVRTYAVRSDADSYAANLSASISPANPNLSVQSGDVFFLNTDITTAQNGSAIIPAGASFINLSVPRTFRFYGFNAEASTGTFSIDNVIFNGHVVPTVLTAGFSATTACQGDSTQFTDLSAGPNTVTGWLWDFGDGSPLSTSPNPQHLYAASGAYAVTLIVTDAMLATDTYTDTVLVHEKPVAGFTAPAGVCDSVLVQFLDASAIASGSIVSWDWNFGDPASGAANTSTLVDPQHMYQVQMLYTVTEIVTSDMGCKDTATATISVDSVGITYTASASGTTVTFNSTTINGTAPYTWMWDFGDGSGPVFMEDAVYTYAGPGTYTACVTVIDAAGCEDITCDSIVILSTSVLEAADLSSLLITPNPSADGIFTLDNSMGGNLSIAVYNVLGLKILSRELSQGRHQLDLSSEAEGCYFVQIVAGKKSLTRKIQVAH